MSRLRMMQVSTTTAMLCMGLAVVLKVAAGGTHTFTGKVSDAMCGAKHSEGNIAPADCVRACVDRPMPTASTRGRRHSDEQTFVL